MTADVLDLASGRRLLRRAGEYTAAAWRLKQRQRQLHDQHVGLTMALLLTNPDHPVLVAARRNIAQTA